MIGKNMAKAKETNMRVRLKMLLGLGLFLALGTALTPKANAVSSGTAYVDILVTYSGTLSVNVDTQTYSTYTLTGTGANGYVSPATTMTVTNNGTLTERWELDVSTIAGGANWTLNNATGSTHGNSDA